MPVVRRIWPLLLVAPLAFAVAGDGQDVDEALVRRLAAEAEAALARDPGVRLVEPVPVLLLTRAEALARRRAFGAGLGEDGALTRATDELGTLLLGDNLLGRYLPDEKVVYVYRDTLEDYAGDGPRAAERALFQVLAHELVHAYDDQRHAAVPIPDDLLGLLDDPRGLANLQTQMSLLEGRATYLSERACRAAGRETMRMPSVAQAQRAEVFQGDGTFVRDVAAGAGNTIARMKLLQYAYGRDFTESAFRYGGMAFVDEVFEHLPLSAEELADFELFRQRWAEEVLEERERQAEAAHAAASGEPDPGGAADGAVEPDPGREAGADDAASGSTAGDPRPG